MSSSRAGTWGVVVRLADGSLRYYAPHSRRQGQADWSPRESQARRFPSRDEAERQITAFAPYGSSGAAATVRYEVVRLAR